MIKRTFDIVISFTGLVILSPFFLLIAIIIKFSSKGPVFFLQERVGRNGEKFKIIKFRTMNLDSELKGYLTVGRKDSRITRTGYYLRKFKIDELPQIFNVLVGSMSIVGPRPEVPKYVEMYSDEQMKVLSVRPGITDNASIEFKNENELLAHSKDPEKYYVSEIMPAKLKINLHYIHNHNLFSDIGIMFKTFFTLFR